MIKGHNPNRMQKALLKANGYDWNEWLVIKTFSDSVSFRHKKDEKVITLNYDNSIKRY